MKDFHSKTQASKEETVVQDNTETEEPISPERIEPRVELMPTFPKGMSAFPHCFARSALFSPIESDSRQYCDNKLIPSGKGVSIRYTGEKLGMDDSDTFLQAVIIAQGKPAGEVCFFEPEEFLQGIGREAKEQDLLWLKESLSRLADGKVKIERWWGTDPIETTLLGAAGIDNESGRFFLSFTAGIVNLFQPYLHLD